ncbi:unnamed protein product [Prunus armeniaca]
MELVRTPQATKSDKGVRFQQTFGSLFRPLPASFWGRSKNKSGSKCGFLPSIGVLSRAVEIFRQSVIASGNHALPARVVARGHYSSEALCLNVILLLSRARRNSRISIRITFEPRTDLA